MIIFSHLWFPQKSEWDLTNKRTRYQRKLRSLELSCRSSGFGLGVGRTVGDGTWNPWKSSLSTIYWMELPDCPKDHCFRNSLYYIWVGKKPPNIFFLTQLLAPGGISRWRCGRRKGEWYSDASFAKAGECEECGEFVSWNSVGFFSVLLVLLFRIPFHYHNHGSVENGSLQY